MIYIIWYSILIVSLLSERQAKKTSSIIRFLLPALYILLIGLRGPGVGVDTSAYYEHYFIYGEDGCPFVEIGFDWLNRMCYHLKLGVSAFFTICALITIAPVAIVINKYPNKEYSIAALLFYGMTFASLCNGMRQAMAVGLFFLVASLLYKDKHSKYDVFLYLFGVLFASLFHITSLLLIPLYFIKNVRIHNWTAIILYGLSFLFILFDFSSWIPDISSYEIGNREFSRYEGLSFNNEASSRLGFWISSLPNIIVFCAMLGRDSFKKYPVVSFFVLLSFMLKNISFGMPIIGRISMYFVWFVFVIISSLLNEDFRKKRYLIWAFVLILYVVLTIHTFISQQNELLPYTFMWEGSVRTY